MSNFLCLGSRYWATLKGDIKKQGQIVCKIFGVESNKLRKLIPRPLLEMAFLRITNSLAFSLVSSSFEKKALVPFERR